MNLKDLRKKKGISQARLAGLLGVSRSAVSMWEIDKSQPDPDTLVRLSEILGVSLDELFGRAERHDFDNVFPIATKKVPLLGDIACGEPIWADEQHGEFVAISEDVDCDFCLRAKGDSMTGARIYDGDVVFIRKQDTVENGEVAAVIIDDAATLKRVYWYPEQHKLVLSAENPAYAPFVYVGAELEQIRILGKAVAFQSLIR